MKFAIPECLDVADHDTFNKVSEILNLLDNIADPGLELIPRHVRWYESRDVIERDKIRIPGHRHHPYQHAHACDITRIRRVIYGLGLRIRIVDFSLFLKVLQKVIRVLCPRKLLSVELERIYHTIVVENIGCHDGTRSIASAGSIWM